MVVSVMTQHVWQWLQHAPSTTPRASWHTTELASHIGGSPVRWCIQYLNYPCIYSCCLTPTARWAANGNTLMHNGGLNPPALAYTLTCLRTHSSAHGERFHARAVLPQLDGAHHPEVRV